MHVLYTQALSLLEHVGLCRQPTGGSVALRMKTLVQHIDRWCADVLRYLCAPEGVVQQGLGCCAGEDDQVRKLLLHAPLPIAEPKWTAPRTKVNALLQSHFSRASVPSGDLAADQRTVLQQSTRLLQVWQHASTAHA